jgi:large subunit ribosomal protein L18e
MTSSKKGNPRIETLIDELLKTYHENKAPIWKDVAETIEGPRRHWAEVNLAHISRCLKEGEMGLVPGKILGGGDIHRKVTVAGLMCSVSARRKIEAAGGKFITFSEIMKANPKGSNIRILG